MKNILSNVIIIIFVFYLLYWVLTDGICKIISWLELSGKKVRCKNPFCEYKDSCDISDFFKY